MERRASKAVVLLSGGQDSATALFWALEKYDEVHALSVGYGQRHHAELTAAQDIASLARVPHQEMRMPLTAIGGSALTDSTATVRGTGGFVDDVAGTLPTTYVPGRNALLLVLAAARAAVLGAHAVIIGASQLDYSGYPDCRNEFFSALQPAIDAMLPSSCRPVSIVTPFVLTSKADEVRLARQLGPRAWAALARSVTCYEGQQPGCSRCPACELRSAGFESAGFGDPARDAARRRLAEAAADVWRYRENLQQLDGPHIRGLLAPSGIRLQDLGDGEFGLEWASSGNLLAPLKAEGIVDALCNEVFT